MLNEYIKAALKLADYKKLEDGTWFSEIPGFDGVWANAQSVEECRKELSEVLEEWVLLKLTDGDTIPSINGIDIKIQKVKLNKQ